MEIALLRLESRKSVRRGNENGDPLAECLVSVALLAVELIMSTIVWLIRTLNILPFGSSSGADTMFRVRIEAWERRKEELKFHSIGADPEKLSTGVWTANLSTSSDVTLTMFSVRSSMGIVYCAIRSDMSRRCCHCSVEITRCFCWTFI